MRYLCHVMILALFHGALSFPTIIKRGQPFHGRNKRKGNLIQQAATSTPSISEDETASLEEQDTASLAAVDSDIEPSTDPANLVTSVAEQEEQNQIQKKNEFALPSFSHTQILIISLLSLSGIVEAICFRRFRCFPNMMTGNTVRCMDALAENRLDTVMMYLGLIVNYVSGGALYKFLSTWKKDIDLAWVSKISFGFFLLSDLIGRIKDASRIFPMAVAFGMINAATQESIGAVTNAVTGHYGKIGLGIGENLFLQLKKDSDGKSVNNTPFFTSLQGVCSFGGSLILTNLVFQWIERKHAWLLSRLPPFGMTLGILYYLLLTWYVKSK